MAVTKRTVDGDAVDNLPFIDVHEILILAEPAKVWTAIVGRLASMSRSAMARPIAGVLGCDPVAGSGWDAPGVGSTAPGFRVVAAQEPSVLVVAGRHRFSRYAIIFRLVAQPGGGTRCSAESRGEFPGGLGRLYRTAVIGSRGHVVVTRALLKQVKRRAERP